MMKKFNIALFQCKEVLTDDNSVLKDMYFIHKFGADLPDYVRVSEWQEVDFNMRPVHEMKDESVKALLQKITENDKKTSEIAKKLNDLRGER